MTDPFLPAMEAVCKALDAPTDKLRAEIAARRAAENCAAGRHVFCAVGRDDFHGGRACIYCPVVG